MRRVVLVEQRLGPPRLAEGDPHALAAPADVDELLLVRQELAEEGDSLGRVLGLEDADEAVSAGRDEEEVVALGHGGEVLCECRVIDPLEREQEDEDLSVSCTTSPPTVAATCDELAGWMSAVEVDRDKCGT